ncbi:unnamed protein product [Pieris brassicae]|uniref:Uncharacterized protein n=1 Tax=Pieris brassicae TaxID=7116 RepID=A0A9P0XH14_PIEBR|nr:unnamed protein product [Pieris brassicae]
MNKKPRGFAQEMTSYDEDITVVKWLDNKISYLASNFVGIGEKDLVTVHSLWCKKGEHFIEVERPEVRQSLKPQEWAAGGAESELQRYEVLTDEEIVRAAMCEDDEQDEDNSVKILEITKVGNSEAVGALNTALKWAEDNDKFDSHEVMFLRRLRGRAFEMK